MVVGIIKKQLLAGNLDPKKIVSKRGANHTVGVAVNYISTDVVFVVVIVGADTVQSQVFAEGLIGDDDLFASHIVKFHSCVLLSMEEVAPQ